jgi:predicted nucleotidyltransferase
MDMIIRKKRRDFMGNIKKVIQKHQPQKIDSYAEAYIVDPLKEDIKKWAGICLQGISYSGSYAKGTALDSTSDLDLFISLKSSTNNTLKEIYDSLASFLEEHDYTIRRQNVSIRVTKSGYDIDLVPAKNDTGNTNFHKLYSKKKDSWIKTNVKRHIDIIKNSNRVNEITALKVWRNNHNLSFPSLMIELMTVEGLKYKAIGDLENNVWFMLEYIENNIESKRIVDPSNTNNVISDSMSKVEKARIKKIAKECRSKSYWGCILW